MLPLPEMVELTIRPVVPEVLRWWMPPPSNVALLFATVELSRVSWAPFTKMPPPPPAATLPVIRLSRMTTWPLLTKTPPPRLPSPPAFALPLRISRPSSVTVPEVLMVKTRNWLAPETMIRSPPDRPSIVKLPAVISGRGAVSVMIEPGARSNMIVVADGAQSPFWDAPLTAKIASRSVQSLSPLPLIVSAVELTTAGSAPCAAEGRDPTGASTMTDAAIATIASKPNTRKTRT